MVIGLAIIVIGRKTAYFSIPLAPPASLAAILWSIWTIPYRILEVWASALTLPLTQRPDWSLAWASWRRVCRGVPSLFSLESFGSPELDSDGRPWLTGWLQVTFACLVAGTVVPGLSQAARVAPWLASASRWRRASSPSGPQT